MYFLVNESSPEPLDNFKVYRCIGPMMWMVLDNILCDLDSKVKVIYFTFL